jgi:hypothetical protein
MWEPRRLTILWASTACYRDSVGRKADNLTAICEPTLYKMCEPRRLTTLWASTACYRDSVGRKADKLTAICEPTLYKMCEPRRLTTLWASTACYRDNFTFSSWYATQPIIHVCLHNTTLWKRTEQWRHIFDSLELGERASRIHWTGDWVGPRTGLDAVE